MNPKHKRKLLNKKDYLILSICLIIFYIGGSYFLFGGSIPNDINLIYLLIAGIAIAIPITIFLLKNMN